MRSSRPGGPGATPGPWRRHSDPAGPGHHSRLKHVSMSKHPFRCPGCTSGFARCGLGLRSCSGSGGEGCLAWKPGVGLLWLRPAHRRCRWGVALALLPLFLRLHGGGDRAWAVITDSHAQCLQMPPPSPGSRCHFVPVAPGRKLRHGSGWHGKYNQVSNGRPQGPRRALGCGSRAAWIRVAGLF